MQCSKEEALVRLFYNTSTFFNLLLLVYFFSSTLLSRLLHFLANIPIFRGNQAEYDYSSNSDEEAEEDEEVESQEQYGQNDRYDHQVDTGEDKDLVADIIHDGETLLFYTSNVNSPLRYQTLVQEAQVHFKEPSPLVHEEPGNSDASNDDQQFSAQDSSFSHQEGEDGIEEEISTGDSDSPRRPISDPNKVGPTLESDRLDDKEKYEERCACQGKMKEKERQKFSGPVDERVRAGAFVQHESEVEANMNKFQALDKDDEEIYGDSCTVGSTSKSSSEWRSSINCRDSGTEDPFSSSSRRSCPKWESYTVFQKYDEEMMFLDRISAQKLHETESLRSIQVSPRSVSERIVRKIATINKKPSDVRHNPFRELEAAYAAQICLTWEALNWNYKNFQRKRAARRDFDPGCPAHVAQQFQQFQVLLQRYVENEPYEHGRRPEVYARVRLLAPKLLQVPEYRDSDDDQTIKDDGFRSRISSAAFLMIMEDGIRTFMNFLKADKEKPCRALAAFFKRKRRSSVDPALLALMKKVNNKKKAKLKDLRRAGKCMRKRKLNVDEETEILMGLIDLKVVARVLRMSDLNEEQLHWCEEKMSKVRIWQGKLQRDSSPLFFPAH